MGSSASWNCARFAPWFGLFIVATSFSAPFAWGQDSLPADTGPAEVQDRPLADLFREARERFRAPGDEQLGEARADFVRSANELETYVQPRTANGQRWLKYLRWEELREQLADDATPNVPVLVATYQQLNRDEVGLELPQFRSLSDALRKYIDRLSLNRVTEPADLYARQLEQLSADLGRLRASVGQPAGDGTRPFSTFDIGRRLDFVAGVGQAPELVAAIRREFARPNAFLFVSADLVRAAASEPINRTDPVTDNILGTSIRGASRTTGNVEATTVPSDNTAAIMLATKGHIESNNSGYNGPAVIRSTGHTDFEATKTVEFSDQAFISPPASVTATSDSDIHSVAKAGGGIGSRLVSTQGMSQARQKQGQANAIAADHAEDRIRRRIDDEVGKKLRDARQRYENEFRRPLARRGDLPEDIRFASTDAAVTVSATQANRGQLGAWSDSPELPSGQDVVARLHESAVNNYAASLLGGATASETEPGQDGLKFDVNLPKWMKDLWGKRNAKSPEASNAASSEFKATSLTFRPGRPISIRFDDNKAWLTIHLTRMTSGDEQFSDWDVTGVFAPSLSEGGVVLVREGELTVFPTDFDRGGDQPLNSRQVAERSNITKVLNERSAEGRGFPSRIEFGRIEPTGAMEKVGPLEAQELHCDDGWLTLAWRRQSAE